jgi:hypothetical protein
LGGGDGDDADVAVEGETEDSVAFLVPATASSTEVIATMS